MEFNFRRNKSKMITFRIAEAEENDIKQIAKTEGVEKTEAARALLAGVIKEYLKGIPPKPYGRIK